MQQYVKSCQEIGTGQSRRFWDRSPVSGLVWVLSGYIALPHKFMGVCRDWGDVICLASCGDYLAPTQRGMFYTEL